MATKKKQKAEPDDVAVSAVPAEKPAKRKPRKAASVEVAPAVVVAPVVEPAPEAPVAPVIVPVVDVVAEIPRPTRQQIAARAFWHFNRGSRDTLGNWLRAEREMADVVARGQVAPTDRWIRALAEG